MPICLRWPRCPAAELATVRLEACLAGGPIIRASKKAVRAASQILDKTTFADLLRGWTDKQNKFVLNWEI